MIVKYTSIVGSVVAELRDQTKIGRISEVVIDSNKISITAFAIDMPFWSFQKNKFVLGIDVVHLLRDGVIIDDVESIIEPGESIQLEKMIKAKCFGIGQRVETSSGEHIGTVYDFLVETDNLAITKFYIKQLFSERIISKDNVLAFDGKTIKIKDNYASNRIGAVTVADATSMN